jgi:PhzF family phenazine biosynthesis protein
LDRLNPDFKKLSEFSERKGVCGVHAFTLDAHEGTAICRNFCPLYGINEEAATGTANGALAYYLYKNNILKDFEKDYVFLQGITMGRPSMVTARLADEESPRVLVGGKAVILTRGEIYL